MSAIHAGSNDWAGSVARASGNGFGARGTATHATVSINVTTPGGAALVSLISDVAEEGQIPEPREVNRSSQKATDTLSEEIADGSDELSASDELVAAIAKHLMIIETVMRQHQTAGTFNFQQRDGDTGTDNNAVGNTSRSFLLGEMLQDPGSAFAATIPRQNRLALLSLLSG
jgi:hypothetical protein